jgi:tape measure domain-containing protein
VAAYFAIDSVVGFAKSIVDVERKMEILQNRINFVFDSATGGTLAFNRLREMSIRLGIEFTSLAEGFASFGIAAKMAGFSASESEGMFSKVAVALRASGASSIQTQRSFYALQQMLSKGVVAAEELRRQLGEALPGASDLMTKAYNRLHPAQELTNRQFTKLLEDGKIISAEILPEFANVVEEVFAPALSGKQNSLDASINRVTTQLDRFKLALANFLPTKAVANTLSDFFGSLNTMMEAGFKDFVRLGALAASGNFAAFDSELAKLEIVRAAETAKAEREQKDIENRIKQRAELYAKQGVSAEKAISGETDRITEQRKELEELNKELERREIALKKARTANVGQPGTAGMRGMADVVGAKEALKQQKELVKQKEREIEFTQGLITAIGQLSQKREEEQEKVSADTKKAEIAAAKELLAAEETRLVATTEGTTAYYNQLVKVIEARKNLAKIEQRDTPQAMGLSLAKLDKDLEKARKMIGSFDPNVAEVIEEGVYVPSVDALQKLDKEIRKQREDELELAIVTAKNLVETTEEGTQARANAEEWLALQVSELEKFKVRISTDSEELKAAKIALINEELKNQLKNINKEIVDDSVASNEKIVELIQKANDLIEKTQLDTYRRRRAIVKQQFEAMANDIKEAMSQTGDFEALAQLAKALSGVEQAGKKAISSLDLNQVGEVIDDIGGLYSAVAGYQSTLLNNEAILLKEQLDQKLISEEEYNRKSLELEKKRFEQEKKVATLEATINAASGIVKAIAQQKYWQAALITATLAAQIAAIQSQQFPGFKDGVIDINGPGTGTSDSIPARLSRGESVMTADETKRYKPVLQAIRDNNFEEFVSKRYIDAMGSQNVSSAVGNSFAENLTNSFDLQTAELAHLLKQNRKVAIKNVDELAKAMSRRNTTEKVINRRRFK